jgi:hypothetical protein
MSDYHLGINMGHDRSAVVVRDGQILIAIEQERLDRIKHSVGFLYQAGGTRHTSRFPVSASATASTGYRPSASILRGSPTTV